MSENFINPLKEFKEQITVLSNVFPDYLLNMLNSRNISINQGIIELGKKESWIDWSRYPNHYSFYYDFDNNEAIVKEWLKQSRLHASPFIIMEFGYQQPISKIPTDIFINYWYELVIIAGYESVVFSSEGDLFMEFVRKDSTLKTNFIVKPV